MLGINGAELLVLVLIIAAVVGPERLPGYAEQLATWVRAARRTVDQAKRRVTEELGPDADDFDWSTLDPTRYDPRRIVREALTEDQPQPRARRPRPAPPP